MSASFLSYLEDETRVQRLVGAYDAVSAKLVEEAGFDAIWGGGLCISAAKGKPDANILSADQVVSALRTMRTSVDIPIIGDCDSGFGDFHNVIHLVKELEHAQISGMCIEDKVFPKLNSFSEARGQSLEHPDVFATKIRAAAEHRSGNDFVIIARVEALIESKSMTEALDRAHKYKEAGADAIVIHSKKKAPDEIFEFANKWKHALPLIVIPTTYTSITLAEMQAHKISATIYANQVMRAAIHTMKMYLAELEQAQSLDECATNLASVQEIFRLQNMDQYAAREKRYRAS